MLLSLCFDVAWWLRKQTCVQKVTGLNLSLSCPPPHPPAHYGDGLKAEDKLNYVTIINFH